MEEARLLDDVPGLERRRPVLAGAADQFPPHRVAIAATLFVIELAAPAAGENVWHAVAHELPAMAAFAVSFVTILILWVNHHNLFAGARTVDRGLLFLNGLVLLAISFPTATLGRVLQGGAYAAWAAVFYAAVLLIAAASFTGLWLYLQSHQDLLDRTCEHG